MAIYRRTLAKQLGGMIFCLGLAVMSSPRADEPFSRFQAGLDLTTFQYKEFDDDGDVLDREDGPLPGILLGLELYAHPYSLALRVSGHDKVIDYNGQTQSGIPLKTTTAENIRRYSLTLKRSLLHEPVSLKFVAEIGQRRWQRHIHETDTTNSLYEVYRWPYYLLGGEMTLWTKHRINLGLVALGGMTFDSELDVRINGYKPVTLELKDGETAHVSMPITFNFDNGGKFVVAPHVQYWYFEKSLAKPLLYQNNTTAGLVHEPENETLNYGVTFTLHI